MSHFQFPAPATPDSPTFGSVAPAAMQRRRRQQQRIASRFVMLLASAAGSAVAFVAFRPLTPSSASVASAASLVTAASPNAGSRSDSPVTRHAEYEPILRRDPTVNQNMQRFIKQQLKGIQRQVGEADYAEAKRNEQLRRLGLAHKIKPARPWHIEHIAQGDVYKGYFEHPSIGRGDRINIELKISDTFDGGAKGTWEAEGQNFNGAVSIQQDFPIETLPGDKRDMDITTYLFHKFNLYWRAWKDKPVPKAEEMEHVSLPGLRLYFQQVAQVEGYPSEEEFDKVCADPEKGMTKAEFLQWIKADSPDYLDETLIGFYTGRRVRITDGDLVLDGDFQDKALGFIIGYATYKGTADGTFVLQLVGQSKGDGN